MYGVLVAKPIIRHTTANELWDHWCLREVAVVQTGGRCSKAPGPNGWSLFKCPWSKRVVAPLHEARCRLGRHRVGDLADTHRVGHLADTHRVGDLADTHRVGHLADTHRVVDLADTHRVGHLADTHRVGHLADTHRVGHLSDTMSVWSYGQRGEERPG